MTLTSKEKEFIDGIKAQIEFQSKYFEKLLNSADYSNEAFVQDLKCQFIAYSNISLFVDLQVEKLLKASDMKE